MSGCNWHSEDTGQRCECSSYSGDESRKCQSCNHSAIIYSSQTSTQLSSDQTRNKMQNILKVLSSRPEEAKEANRGLVGSQKKFSASTAGPSKPRKSSAGGSDNSGTSSGRSGAGAQSGLFNVGKTLLQSDLLSLYCTSVLHYVELVILLTSSLFLPWFLVV
ncbi:hypothetical protein K435DRAFT_803350 [Dendrothele bispora CBS 962.96]|uniref:Uncharacterized protein n=1 Tax=Dendrothele bispora (strain CBS 962.96) TaxID=1314807 RepID=A0A4V4HDU2_DENBC|nr:hypothetical protein K435DRAFT_803350 [Dendrothele bispora CBS 962.96]